MTTGKQKNDFPGAFIPFDKSVGTVPTVPIDSFPTVQLCVNEEWLPYLVTCLKALARPETWDDTYNNAVIAASEFATLIGNIQDGCGIVVPSVGCFSGSFLDLDYGFVSQPGAFCVSTWVDGTGWTQCCDSTPQAFLNIKREFGASTVIRAVSVVIKVTAPYLVDYSVKLLHGTTYTIIASDSAVTGPTIVVDVTGLSEPAESLWIDVIETFGGCAADIVVTDFSLCYTGAFPLSVPPDTWSHTFDFTADDGSWLSPSVPPYNSSVWTSGVGWKGQDSFVDGQHVILNLIERTLSANRITGITISYSSTMTANTGTRLMRLRNSGSTIVNLDLNSGAGSFTDSFAVDALVDEMWVNVDIGNGGDGTEYTVISRIVVTGIGTDPF